MNDEPRPPATASVLPPTRLNDWLPRVRAGDDDAARFVVEQLHDHVRKIVLAHLPRRDAPEDLMQEVFMKAFSRLDQFRGEMPFEHWIARIAVTTCQDRLRRQHARPEWRWADLSEDEQKFLHEMPGEISAAETADESARDVLDKLIATLTPAEQSLIRWLDLEEKSIAEVCALTGWNSGVTRIRAFRARQKLKAAWRKLENSQS
jgi:RNA polymerase sigma-70 factor (ECF subfamily)